MIEWEEEEETRREEDLSVMANNNFIIIPESLLLLWLDCDLDTFHFSFVIIRCRDMLSLRTEVLRWYSWDFCHRNHKDESF
mmetsp:Transcript_37591/g.59324  ORF Transcript_37591/g.59324 Transcript_37591/m.59324 type:complete len:81 (-) Transcript_37591:37-279(-)